MAARTPGATRSRFGMAPAVGITCRTRSGRPFGRRWPRRPGRSRRRAEMFRRNENDERHDGPIQPREVRGKGGDRAEVTVVGHGANLEGTVVSTGSLRVDGRVVGKISAEGDVMLSEQS